MESFSQKKADVPPKQHRIATWNGGDLHTLGHTGSNKGAVVEDSLQLTSEKQKMWEQLKRELGGVLSNSELPAGRPPARHPVHRTELPPDAASSFVPMFRRSLQLDNENKRQADEIFKKATSRNQRVPLLIAWCWLGKGRNMAQLCQLQALEWHQCETEFPDAQN